MPGVVSDASVLISLGGAQQLHLLRDFYHEVFVPTTVWQEVTGLGVVLPGAKEAIAANQEGWLKIKTPSNQVLVATL